MRLASIKLNTISRVGIEDLDASLPSVRQEARQPPSILPAGTHALQQYVINI